MAHPYTPCAACRTGGVVQDALRTVLGRLHPIGPETYPEHQALLAHDPAAWRETLFNLQHDLFDANCPACFLQPLLTPAEFAQLCATEAAAEAAPAPPYSFLWRADATGQTPSQTAAAVLAALRAELVEPNYLRYYQYAGLRVAEALVEDLLATLDQLREEHRPLVAASRTRK